MTKTTVAALQMVATPDRDENLATARALVSEAARAGATLVALPEFFCIMGHDSGAKLAVAERAAGDGEAGGPIQAMLAEAARTHGVWLIGGTLPLAIDGDAGHATNTCLVFAPDGRPAARYDKVHLFRFDDGATSHDERRTLREGAAPVAFDAGPLRVGLSVCYDLRFPELYRALMRPAPCDLIAVPSAFTHTTGLAHWHVLLRARAIENQCWVIAPAQGGVHPNGRRTFGHSLVVDPWGTVVAERAEGAGVVLAEIDTAATAAVRARLPALEHRRL